MQARYAFVAALLKINTRQAAEAALAHSIKTTCLNGYDNQCLRNIAPLLFLLLGKDQEYYDFMKWWAVTENTKVRNVGG
jgi:hypothetical protein